VNGPKRYFRHRQTGDRGFLVEVNGEARMQYDRGSNGHAEQVKYNEHQWQAEEDEKPITWFQVGQVAWEADAALCRLAGVGPRTRKPWLSLRDSERQDWIKNGPPVTEPMRRLLYEAHNAFGRVYAR